MTQPPLSVRLVLWRLTRHPTTRRLYDAIERRGVFLAQLDRFRRPAAGDPETPEPPAGVRLSTTRAADGVPDRLAGSPIAPDDVIVRAHRGGETVGSCCLSHRPVYVPELHRRLDFEGTYLWKLCVAPAERGRGIGSAIIGRAIEASAATTAGIEALVAPDNLPSRRAFSGCGFHPVERFTSLGAGRHQWHRQQPLDGKTPELY